MPTGDFEPICSCCGRNIQWERQGTYCINCGGNYVRTYDAQGNTYTMEKSMKRPTKEQIDLAFKSLFESDVQPNTSDSTNKAILDDPEDDNGPISKETMRSILGMSDLVDSKRTLLVNLFAGPGAGKSSVRAGTFAALKFDNVECEEALEFAKDLVWEGRKKTFEDQIYLFGKQYHRVFRLLGQVDVIITDSPFLLSVIYDENHCPDFERFVVKKHKQLWTYNVFVKRIKPYNRKGRNQDEAGAMLKDREIADMLYKHGIPFETVEGSWPGVHKLTTKIKTILKSQ